MADRESTSKAGEWRLPEPAPRGGMSLRGALLYHYYEAPLCRRLMQLLQVVADALRAMHAEGVRAPGLRNEDIIVVRDDDGTWTQAWISEGKTSPPERPLTDEDRGADTGGLILPSELRRVLVEMQTAPEPPSEAFLKGESRTRKRMTPQKEAPLEKDGVGRAYPDEKDIWIWDDRSMQAVPALRSRDKRAYYRKRDALEILRSELTLGRRVRREAKRIVAEEAWRSPVEMKGRIGLSCNLEPDRFEKERRWLKPLGPIPLLVRLYHHETEARTRFAIDAVRRLQAEGHRMTVALVQDRKAVLFPKKWRAFVDYAAGALSGFVEGFEVGHAVNRVKWGLWNYGDYAQLLEPFANWSDRFPQIALWGPAGIDFEFPRILPFLRQMPEGLRWEAFSHHMYVDRRGAPENSQQGYTTVDKLAMARAAARLHPQCEERVVVSEVNWPLTGTGVWSPVGSPYQSPGPRHNDPSVDEDTYADYMRRYLCLALCSGMADRVYWWNLAAHGFGLIDDRGGSAWRPRPAYHEFKRVVEMVDESTFVRREGEGPEAVYHFEAGGKAFSL